MVRTFAYYMLLLPCFIFKGVLSLFTVSGNAYVFILKGLLPPYLERILTCGDIVKFGFSMDAHLKLFHQLGLLRGKINNYVDMGQVLQGEAEWSKPGYAQLVDDKLIMSLKLGDVKVSGIEKFLLWATTEDLAKFRMYKDSYKIMFHRLEQCPWLENRLESSGMMVEYFSRLAYWSLQAAAISFYDQIIKNPNILSMHYFWTDFHEFFGVAMDANHFRVKTVSVQDTE